jgi:glucosamine 6-phosphate synthetase-like amidotransferase/phosphosugar isomerase protein
MCGIATIALGKRSRGRIPYPLLRNVCRELMIELQPRGIDAAGIAVINEGAESKVFKMPLRPERLVVRPMYDEMLGRIGPETNFIMLHARATTVGSTEDNFNNHPIITPPIVGIHNGTLYNEDQLFQRFNKDFEREGDVDSEVIFKLYLHFVEQGLSPKQAMSQAGSLLRGAFTGALVDMRNPAQMVMFKHERSLCVFRFPYYDMILAVSEARFYDRVAKRLNMKAKETCEFVYDGTGMIFDLNIENRITDEIIDFDIPVQKGYVRQYSGWLSGMMD